MLIYLVLVGMFNQWHTSERNKSVQVVAVDACCFFLSQDTHQGGPLCASSSTALFHRVLPSGATMPAAYHKCQGWGVRDSRQSAHRERGRCEGFQAESCRERHHFWQGQAETFEWEKHFGEVWRKFERKKKHAAQLEPATLARNQNKSGEWECLSQIQHVKKTERKRWCHGKFCGILLNHNPKLFTCLSFFPFAFAHYRFRYLKRPIARFGLTMMAIFRSPTSWYSHEQDGKRILHIQAYRHRWLCLLN